jgi:hypothetical protein
MEYFMDPHPPVRNYSPTNHEGPGRSIFSLIAAVDVPVIAASSIFYLVSTIQYVEQ